jgi:sialic acid synthase SpsE/protoporphyrinogen oxidase
MFKTKRKAYILGAGPTGLITAWKLLERGWNVTIIEKQKITGGLCRSWKWKDFILDTGPHIFHTPDKLLEKYWKKKFGNLLVEGKFSCKNVKGKNFDQYFDYPLSLESLEKFPKDLKIKIKKEIKSCNKKNQRYKAKNYKEYIDSFIGPTLRTMFFEKYPKKIWGIDTKKMTPDWAPNRIKFRKKILPFYHEEYAAVGKYGTGCIYDRIKKFIIKKGGKFRLQESVIGLKYHNKKIRQIITNKKKYEILKNEIVISSLPINLTSRFLGEKNNLKFRGVCSVYLFYNKKEILPKNHHWLYFDSEKLLFNRVTENKKLSPFVAPKSKSFVTLEITYTQGDKFSKINSKKIINLIKSQFNKLNIINRKYFLGASINYEPFVYPVQFADYKDEVARTKSFVESFENLFSVGAGGEFNYADSQILFHKSFDLANSLSNRYNDFATETKNINTNTLNKKVKIGKHVIGEGNKTFIIAEAGLNHNGSLEIAKKLIDNAKASYCDAIKFQSFLPHSRVSKGVKSEKYAEKIIGTQESISELFIRLSLKFDVQKKIFAYAKKKKIMMFSTPFDFQSVDFLDKMGVSAFKIASADLVNIPLIKYVGLKNKPTIISTGMSKISEIDEAVEAFKSTGNENLILLHCNSSYPSTYSEVNLRFIDTLRKMYQIPIGFSDHTTDLLASKTAISIGANVVERHFTLSKKMEGPDHILSSEKNEMTDLVNSKKFYIKWKLWQKKNISNKKKFQNINLILGDGIKKIQPNEYITINSQKKSLFAKKRIKKGELFTKNNISIKGPVVGLMPKYYEIIINKRSLNNIEEDQPITWNDI